MNSLCSINYAWTFIRKAVLALMVTGLFGSGILRAQNDPYFGYSNTNSYFLSYSSGSFDKNSDGDVKIATTINGKTLDFDVDTGSRGLYVASTELEDPDHPFDYGTNSYAGEIQLTSSHRVSSGTWTTTTLSFSVNSSGTTMTVTATANILVVDTIGAQSGKTASYKVDTSAPGYDGFVKLVSGTTKAVTVDSNGDHVIVLSNSGSGALNEQAAYADNKGVLKGGSNFGIGFDLNGVAGGTGPVGPNMNQIYNPLINLTAMRDGTMVAGYIIEKEGIQLGLTGSNTGFAYTTLNPTGFASTNSVPDWQTPMGQTVVSGTVKGPGSVVMDSGISGAYVSAPGLEPGTTITDGMSVYLMNSGGAVGYNITGSGTSSVLNPSEIEVVKSGTDGIYSQNQGPYQDQYFNTGRNVFKAFDMLYDAQNGYMGVKPNEYGSTDPNVFFAAQAGGFPNPIPEGSSAVMVLMGGVFVWWAKRRGGRSQR